MTTVPTTGRAGADVVRAGHGATIHAATVKYNSLVGMGAILLDGVTVRRPPCK